MSIARQWPHIVVITLIAMSAPRRCGVAIAQDTPAPDAVASGVTTEGPIDPYQAMREGNRRLKEGKPAEALELYERAHRELPDAREIAFAEGLSQYHLGDYERARSLFRQAAAGENDSLADDATYSIGTTYHSDALLARDDPKAALAQLEQAMEHYQSVLSHDPDHAATRDAYRKAGATWRTIKQQMQQQQQQSSDGQNKEDRNEDEQQDQDQRQQEQPQDQQDQDQQSEKQQQSDEKQEQQQQEQDEQQEQQQQDDEQDHQQQSSEQSENEQESDSSATQEQQDQPEEQEEPKPVTADQEEQVSREQAQRRLRAMMQAVRERKERRREPTRLVPVRPVDKDW